MTETPNNTDDLSWVQRWLSAERFAPYVAACSNNVDNALRLYMWNISLGQVLMRDIAFFEIALCNAYDRTMRERWGADWLLNDASPVRRPVMRRAQAGELDVNRINRKIIDAAVDGLPKDCAAGALVSSLTLGFWVHLTDRSRETIVWRTILHAAWPKGAKRPDLQRALDGILRIRNRVAHAERLFNPSRSELSPLAADTDAVRLMRDLCPNAAAYLYGENGKAPLELFIEKNPAPVEVRL